MCRGHKLGCSKKTLYSLQGEGIAFHLQWQCCDSSYLPSTTAEQIFYWIRDVGSLVGTTSLVATYSSAILQLYRGCLTLILLTWIIGWAPNNVSKWQMGFNWAFKGLTCYRNVRLRTDVRRSNSAVGNNVTNIAISLIVFNVNNAQVEACLWNF
jgi:hypothetical protein